jgi:hypothetical protein
MANEGKDLVKEAIKDARSLKQAALEAAKNEIIESMTPAIKALLEKNIKGALITERDRTGGSEWEKSPEGGTRQQKKDYGKLATNEGDNPMADTKKDDKELDMESLSSFFPQLAEDPDPDPDPGMEDPFQMGGMKKEEPMSQIPTLGEDPDLDPEMAEKKKHEEPDGDEGSEGEEEVEEGKKKKDDEEEPEMKDDEIEISEAELRKVYESALQMEVNVKKGFGDIVGGGELDQASKETGILDKKSGEKMWNEEEPPAKEDFTVKEMMQRGLAENKNLRENLGKAVRLIQQLGQKLHEVNLFNAKVLHVNRILNQGRLTSEQKSVVMESIDKAHTIAEVKMVYEAIVGSFKATQSLSESKNPRKPTANAQRARTSGTPKSDVLSESADHRGNNGGDKQYARLRELAGLVK